MKNAKSKIKMTIRLPDNFIDEIKTVITDEIRIAQKKWNVSLSLGEKELVVVNSLAQLRTKSIGVFGYEWDLSDTIVILVNSYRNDELTLPDDANKSNLNLRRQGPMYQVDKESLDPRKIISIQDFREEIIETLKNWAKTAAFYGVGSF